MSGLFAIPVIGMKEGCHQYDFELDNEFFAQFEDPETEEGSLVAHIEADKVSTHIDLLIRISGVVSLMCDRCLGKFSRNLECENRLLLKFGEDIDNEDPDIITMPADEHEIDLKQILYEYIVLSLPIRRVHPDDQHGRSTCDPEMLAKLKEHIISGGNETDPRWDELKKLMNNN